MTKVDPNEIVGFFDHCTNVPLLECWVKHLNERLTLLRPPAPPSGRHASDPLFHPREAKAPPKAGEGPQQAAQATASAGAAAGPAEAPQAPQQAQGPVAEAWGPAPHVKVSLEDFGGLSGPVTVLPVGAPGSAWGNWLDRQTAAGDGDQVAADAEAIRQAREAPAPGPVYGLHELPAAAGRGEGGEG